MCHGNICRSPYAAARLDQELTRLAPTAIRVECAGFAIWGRSCPPFALEVAAAQGLDLSKHTSKPIMPVVAVADLIVVMDKTQARIVGRTFERAQRDILILGDFDPEPIAARGIVDPWGQAKEVFEQCYARINRCVDQLVRAVTGSERPRSPRTAPLQRLELLL